MFRSLRSGAVAVCATPQALILIILMFGLWAAAAELYSALIAGSHRGVFMAVTLLIATIPFSFVLFTNFLKLAHDLRELCVPQRRQRLAGALSFILGLMWVIPCALLAWGRWAVQDLLLVTMGMPAGLCFAFLWRALAHRSALGVAGLADSRRALRMVLGRPYAPMPWPMRLGQAVLACAVLALPPVLVGVFGGALGRGFFASLIHAAELLGFLAAVGLCWGWPLSQATALFAPARGALSELALLPGMGAGRQRLQQLLLAVFGIPTAGLCTILIVALGVAWREHLPHAIYWKVIIQFLLVVLITLPIVLSQIVRPSAVRPWSRSVGVMTQIYVFSIWLWTMPWDALRSFMALRWLAWVAIAIAVGAVAYVIGATIHWVRELARRPHPFVET